MGRYQALHFQSLWLTGLIMLAGFVIAAGAGDIWAYFHPEQVTSFGCKVTDTEISYNGVATGDLIWQATAFADREHDKWAMEIGRYAHTTKGRHAAERACMKWQDEAEKRVNAAQPK